MDVDIMRFGRVTVRSRIGKVAKNRPASACGNLTRLLRRPHERRHVMTGAQECVEYCGSDVTGRTGQKDSHGLRLSAELWKLIPFE
jgi:hypothetical protein